MRITVYDVLSYLASGMSQDEILADFPYLEVEDIRASLAFAADFESRFVAEPSLRGCSSTRTCSRAWSVSRLERRTRSGIMHVDGRAFLRGPGDR